MSNDITMCPGGACPLREGCYRFRVVTHGRQNSMGSPPYDLTTGTCQWYLDLASRRPTEGQIRDRAYFIWRASGMPEGRHEEHWQTAEAELERSFLGELRPVT